MESLQSGMPVEGPRTGRAGGRERPRPPRAGIVGEDAIALGIARGLAASGHRAVVFAGSPGGAARLAGALEGRAGTTALFDGAAPLDLLIVRPSGPPESAAARVADAALWAARTCPLTVLLISAADGLDFACAAARASGLARHLILAPGALPRAGAEAARLASRLGVSASQIDLPVIGGETAAQTRPLMRYAAVAGIPAGALEAAPASPPATRPDRTAGDASILAATLAIARAVLSDRRRILCCAGWTRGSFGLPGGFASLPYPIGSRGAGEPLPLRLTLEEKSLLCRVARVP